MSEEGINRTGDTAENVTFPLRVACVDTGSNAIRFMAAEFTDPETYTDLAFERAPVRLGHGVFLDGHLHEDAMERAVAAFVDFRARMDTLGVTHHRAVATSAVRESANGREFVERVHAASGIRLQVIHGPEEARLVHTAIRSRVALGADPWILADLGGGSVEVSLVDETGMLWSESHTMGSVRLLEELAGTESDPGRFHRVLTEYVGTLRIPALPPGRRLRGFIATGGNIEALAKLAAAPVDERGVATLATGDLRSIIDRLARMPYRQRIDDLGLRDDRADVILPAGLVYERLVELTGAETVTVPNVGVKEGVLLDLVDDLAGHRSHEERQEEIVVRSAVGLARRYGVDEGHAGQVASFARLLFDATQPLHGLRFKHRRVLLAAAHLHDIGSYVSRNKHHRHSEYLILNSEIQGLTPREGQRVAAIARYHRKSEPRPGHETFDKLDEKSQATVVRLAALLRVADGLDREHRGAVRDLHVVLEKNRVVLRAVAEDDLLLERVQVKRRGALFERLFERELVLEVAAPVG